MLIYIEGNIGSGKSTFIDLMREHLSKFETEDIEPLVVLEPVDEWIKTTDSSGKNVLSYFYQDMKKYCYMFQSYAFITRIQQLDQIDMTKDIIFIERSIFSDRNVFAKTCHDTNLLNDIEWITYDTWFNNMKPKYQHIFQNSFFIYLQVSPTSAMERIIKRSRNEENKIELSYLQLLHQKHEEWLNTSSKNTIIINAEKNLTHKTEFEHALNTILHYTQPHN